MRLPEKLPEPVWQTFCEAAGDAPAVRVCFAPIGPIAVRAARRAVAEALKIDPQDVETAGDALSRELILRGITAWEGVGAHDGTPIEPTRDVERRDDDATLIAREPGTISLFLSDPDRFEWADRVYVLPWVQRDMAGKGSPPLPAGTGAQATKASNIATSPAKPKAASGARNARTGSTKPKRTRKKPPGKS